MKPMKNKIFFNLCEKNTENGQMIILMGVLLALSVYSIAAISSQLVDIDVVVSRERSTSLLPEFNQIKEAFGKSLNYNLLDNIYYGAGYWYFGVFYGDIESIEGAFNITRDIYYTIELSYDIFFDAKLKNVDQFTGNPGYWYSHNSSFYGHVYNVEVTIILDNGETSITEDVEYYIVCNRREE